jgi:predicted nucleic acid-binding protein
MGLGKKYSKAQSRILELEAALKQALAIINVQEEELKKFRSAPDRNIIRDHRTNEILTDASR